MYIAMNRFKIVKGREKEFEKIWKEQRHSFRQSKRLSGISLSKRR